MPAATRRSDVIRIRRSGIFGGHCGLRMDVCVVDLIKLYLCIRPAYPMMNMKRPCYVTKRLGQSGVYPVRRPCPNFGDDQDQDESSELRVKLPMEETHVILLSTNSLTSRESLELHFKTTSLWKRSRIEYTRIRSPCGKLYMCKRGNHVLRQYTRSPNTNTIIRLYFYFTIIHTRSGGSSLHVTALICCLILILYV